MAALGSIARSKNAVGSAVRVLTSSISIRRHKKITGSGVRTQPTRPIQSVPARQTSDLLRRVATYRPTAVHRALRRSY